MIETIATKLDELNKQAKLIKRFENKYKDKFANDLRLRPSVGSFSLVSCADKTSQSGWSKLGSENGLNRAFGKAIQRQRRNVPEKKLQSWLIREARKGARKIQSISELLGDQFWFVSDEIAISDPVTKKKFVADMLLVRVDNKNLAQLVNVELKYQRSMDTFRQVIKFREVLENPRLRRAWQHFAEIMTGRTFQWHLPQKNTYGLVIWPTADNPSRALANKKRADYERIGVLGFMRKGPKAQKRYVFKIE
ncbi:MAG: hypothetical protein P4L87_21370 [Formivibrio sp.]|nr:hypothetical protein [Formivibrio sp.]